jgi:two-component system KDP operon response regulator KdpE
LSESATEEDLRENLVLVVDDDPKLIGLVQEVLTASGFEVICTGRGEKAIELAALEQPGLIILDVVLADDVDGYMAAKRIRQFSDVPIVMLTAKAREDDLLRGFSSGVDDYLTKPFGSKELLARVRAVLKRTENAGRSMNGPEIVCDDMRIDPARRRVRIGDREVALTRTEFELLLEMAQHPNKVLLHEQLLTAVWGNEYRDDLDYLRAYIRYLRQKLETDPAHPKRIMTSRGVGYMLVCAETPI